MSAPAEVHPDSLATPPRVPAGHDGFSPARLWSVRAVSGVALALSLYLAILGLTQGNVPGCEGGDLVDCSDVLSSRWSTWLGVPVGALGVALFSSLLATSAFVGSRLPRTRELAMFATYVLTGMAVLAAVWFIALQVFELGRYCLPCMAAHTCSLALGAIMLTSGATRLPLAAAISLLGAAPLVAGQWLYEPQQHTIERVAASDTSSSDSAAGSARDAAPEKSSPAANQSKPSPPPAPSRWLTVPKSTLKIDTHAHPIVGSPDAKHVVIKLFDYGCHHCRDLHHQLESVRRRAGGELSVIVLPTPLNHACNKHAAPATTGPHQFSCVYAKLALAVWLADRSKFAEYHQWLFERDKPPDPTSARKRAKELVGVDAFDRAYDGYEVSSLIDNYVEIYGSVEKGSLPLLLLPDAVISGRFASDDKLFEVLQSQLGLKK